MVSPGSVRGNGVGKFLFIGKTLFRTTVDNHNGIVIAEHPGNRRISRFGVRKNERIAGLQESADNDQRQRNRNHRAACPAGNPAKSLSLGGKRFLFGFSHRSVQKKHQCRQKRQRGDCGNDNPFHQHDSDVKPDAEGHKQQRPKPGNRSQGAGRNRLDHRQNCRLHGTAPVRCLLPYPAVCVQQNNAVVNGKRQLQNCRNGIGNIRDFPEKEIGSAVQENRNTGRRKQYNRFQPRFRGNQQNRQNKAEQNCQNIRHFPGDGILQGLLFHRCPAILHPFIGSERRADVCGNLFGMIGVIVPRRS